MTRYEDEAKKVIIFFLKGGHSKELSAMKYVMDEAEKLGTHRKELHDAIVNSLKDHSCSCSSHWGLSKIARKISDEDNESENKNSPLSQGVSKKG